MTCDDILKIAAFLVTIATFVAGLWRYIDSRNREDQTRKLHLYLDLMRLASAVTDDGKYAVPLTQQLAAIYEIQHFPQFKYSILPILSHLRDFFATTKPPNYQLLTDAIDTTLSIVERGS
jgi:hypothetical protein